MYNDAVNRVLAWAKVTTAMQVFALRLIEADDVVLISLNRAPDALNRYITFIVANRLGETKQRAERLPTKLAVNEQVGVALELADGASESVAAAVSVEQIGERDRQMLVVVGWHARFAVKESRHVLAIERHSVRDGL